MSSYLANFNSFNGQSFRVLPAIPAVGGGDVVVRSLLQRADGSSDPARLRDEHGGPAGWRVVDVLTNGTISRVAVQRSDFRQLC